AVEGPALGGDLGDNGGGEALVVDLHLSAVVSAEGVAVRGFRCADAGLEGEVMVVAGADDGDVVEGVDARGGGGDGCLLGAERDRDERHRGKLHTVLTSLVEYL